MKRRFSIDKHKSLTPILSLFTMFMLISVGFASWYVGGDGNGSIGNNILVANTRDGAIDYNIVSDGNQDYIDMRFTKQFSKSGFTSVATSNQNNCKTVEYIQADLKWKNVNSSYNDDISDYFYLTDIDNPMSDNAPKLYNHETNDTVQFDKEQKIYRDTNTFRSSMVYGFNYQNFETTCTPDWTNFEPVYDTAYEAPYADGGSSASTYGGEWVTVAENFTGNNFPWFRADLRCLKKNDKYYFLLLYVFHYTTAHPYAEGRVCRYRVNALTTFSSYSIESLSDIAYSSGYSSYTSGTVNSTTNKYASQYMRVCYTYKRTSSASSATNGVFTVYPCTPYGDDGKTYSGNGYVYDTSASVAMTNPANYANVTRSVYREVDYTMPIVGNAYVANVTASDIKWSYIYTYYIKNVTDPQSTRTGNAALSTPLNYVFDHFEFGYINQYQYSGAGAPAKFYFKNVDTGETIVRTVNDNISVRTRNCYYKLVNRVKENTLTFDYVVRLRPKNATVKANLKEYLKAYTYSLTIEMVSTEISTYARTS